MMNEDEINSLKEGYNKYCMSCLYEVYLELKNEVETLVENDNGVSLLDSSKELEIVANEIHSRSLDEKIKYIKKLSQELYCEDVNTEELAKDITVFIFNFLPNYK